MNEHSDWSAYEKLVMSKLETLEEEVTTLQNSLVLVRIDIAGLKVRAGIWGALAGAVPAGVGVLAVLLSQ